MTLVHAAPAAANTNVITQGGAELILFHEGRTVQKAGLSWYDFGGGNYYVKFEYHGRRTVTGGDSQAVGPQRVEKKVCSRLNCQHQFDNIDFRYGCNDWVWTRISIVDEGPDTIIGTPVWRPNC